MVFLPALGLASIIRKMLASIVILHRFLIIKAIPPLVLVQLFRSNEVMEENTQTLCKESATTPTNV